MIYGHYVLTDVSENNYEEILHLKQRIEYTGYENLGGILILFREHNLSSHFIKFCEELKENGLEVILGFLISPEQEGKYKKQLAFIKEATKVTKKLALATHGNILEWIGGREKAENFKKIADENGFEWVCTVTHKILCVDYKEDWGLRHFLVENNIFCICLCGYVLAGYLYDDLTIPHLWDTTLRYRNLHKEFGLEIERFSEYLEPLNIFSGAGGPSGLYAGSQIYCERLNFKGMCTSLPFDIKETRGMKVNNEPLSYPQSCGPPGGDGGLPIGKRYDISRHPSGVVPNNKIITFAFDNAYFQPNHPCLLNDAVEFAINSFLNRVIREHYRKGYKTIVVTSRKKEDLENIYIEMQHEGLPVQHIFHTSGELKGPLLKKIGSTLHYDGDDKQIESARAHGIEAIKV